MVAPFSSRVLSRPVFALAASVFLFVASIACLRAASPEETPEPYRSMPARLQARAGEFPLVPVATGDEPLVVTTITLNKSPERFDTGHAFDAVRFRAPERGGLDLVWAFTAPATWRHWYILPVEGETKRGFENWINGDRAYVGFDGAQDNPVTLQTLAAAYFEPGREYLLWFCQTTHTPEPATLKLTLRFALARPADEPWERESVEKALKLETAPTATQAAYFASRGARVLLDAELFHPKDASSQMEHFLFTRRQTEFLKGGFFITVETACPPCHGAPLLADIVRRHGEPDCVLTAAQQNLDRTAEANDSPSYDRHHYDHFIFETDPADADKRVRRVSSQYFNANSARPADGARDTWTEVTLTGIEFRLFFREGREVGRYRHWGEPGAKLVSGAIPEGEYRRAYVSGEPMEKLVHDGAGGWAYESYHRSGPAYRRCGYKDGRLDGALTDFFEDGRERVSAGYAEGRIHGRLRVWEADGRLVRDQVFERGELVGPGGVGGAPGGVTD
ncbi:MAG: hypothetical protein H7067_07855 [Burkholderiales bacterium]|nr:hypothetical protein [Opitutaceae bacterium]